MNSLQNGAQSSALTDYRFAGCERRSRLPALESAGPMSVSPGTRIGPYEIVSTLGAGGMGEVYRARDTTLDRDVAIKVLPDAVVARPRAPGALRARSQGPGRAEPSERRADLRRGSRRDRHGARPWRDAARPGADRQGARLRQCKSSRRSTRRTKRASCIAI